MSRTKTTMTLVAVIAATLWAAHPAAAGSSSSAGLAAGDFNGDGIEDLATGVPEEDVGPPDGPGEVLDAGAVHVLYGKTGGLRAAGGEYLHQEVPGATEVADANDRFGYSLAAGDLDGDGFDDLAVGVPGEASDVGGVHIFFGSATGIVMTGNRVLTQGAGANGVGETVETDDGFAQSVVIGNFGNGPADDLVIGAPYENIGAHTNAGVAHVVYGDAGGPNVATAKLLHQDLPKVRSSVEPGDHFGATLAARDFGRGSQEDLAVGDQYEDVPNADEQNLNGAGAVTVFYGSTGGLRTNGSQYWHQDVPGVPDKLEIGDGFGTAVTGGDFGKSRHGDLAIGAAYETVGSASGGAAYVLYGSANGLVTKGSQMWHGDKPNVAGDAEDTDYFGRSMTAGDVGRSSHDELVVGAPHDTYESTTFASGTALVLYGSDRGLRANGSQEWDQTRSGMEGEPDVDEYFARGLVSGDFGKSPRDELVFGVPGDDVGSVAAAGAAHVLYGRDGALTTLGVQFWHQDVTGVEDEAEVGDRFGEGPYP